MSDFDDAAVVRQLVWFDRASEPIAGVWRDARTGVQYPVGNQSVYGQDCAGNPLVSAPPRAGADPRRHTVSVDRTGSERRRGTNEVVVTQRDGSAVMALQRDGETRGYRCEAGQAPWKDWLPDPGAATEALRFARMAQPDTPDRWTLVEPGLQRRLHGLVAAVARGLPTRSLWLHGGPGSGKTTALLATIAEAQAHGVAALYLSLPDLALQTRSGYTFDVLRHRTDAMWAEAKTALCLALDDVTAGVRPDSDDLRLRLHDVMDARQRNALVTLVGDNLSPELLNAAGYDARLCSRFTALEPVACGYTDHRAAGARP